MYDLPLSVCARALEKGGCKVRSAGLMIDIVLGDISCTLYRTGRLLVNPCSDEKAAIACAMQVFGILEKNRVLSRLLGENGALL